MGKNSKPILSVLVDEEKKEKFADLARRNKYSMGWLLNDCIDRMIEADSIEVYGEPTRDNSNLNTSSIGDVDVEKLVKKYVDDMDIEKLIRSSISDMDVEKLVRNYVDDADVEKLVRSYVDDAGVEKLVRSYVDDIVNASGDGTVTTESNAKTYPEWVRKEHRTHYDKLANNPELLGDVAEVYATTSGNAKIASELVPLGFFKKGGIAYDSDNISRIKYVLERLDTDAE